MRRGRSLQALIAVRRLCRFMQHAPPRLHCAVASGSMCCCVFSLIAIFFLSALSSHLTSDSIFVEFEGDKQEAASGITVAIVLYAVTMAISIFYWVRGTLRARAAGTGPR